MPLPHPHSQETVLGSKRESNSLENNPHLTAPAQALGPLPPAVFFKLWPVDTSIRSFGAAREALQTPRRQNGVRQGSAALTPGGGEGGAVGMAAQQREMRVRPPAWASPDSLTETSSCLWFLFSTSEAEAEPLVWSLNKLELKLPQQDNWSTGCQRRHRCAEREREGKGE